MKMLTEDSGKTSSMRIVTFVWAIGSFLVWAVSSVLLALDSGSGFEFPTLPAEIVMIVLGLITGKVAQKSFEKKKSE